MASIAVQERTQPVGRRLLVKMLVVGAAGLAVGPYLNPLNWLSGLGASLDVPSSGLGFRIYTVNGIPKFDPATWKLTLGGTPGGASGSGAPQALSLDDLKALPQVDQTNDFHCVTGWVVKNVVWSGVRLSTLLDSMGIPSSGKWVTFYSGDGEYVDSLSMEQATSPNVLVAHTMNGSPLPAEQGAPLRLVIPEMYGYKGVKWLNRIEIKPTLDIGYWEQRGYPVDAFVKK
mgnify:CR=1 FL=1